MKKTIISVLMCATVLSGTAQIQQQLAFPGAEGFGRFARGARAGDVTVEVYRVTNLNDTGKGSFRDAVSAPNRIVVFDVAGVIKIDKRLIFSKNLTIAGQTAPGEGITVYGNGVSFSGASDIIVRYIRFRMGNGGDSGKDAAGIANGENMIFDHVSVSWGLDENFSISWDNKGTIPSNITIQNSIIGQGVMVHACGGLIQTIGGVTIYRNLYIDNKTRNPKVKGLNQFVNNVVYNWGSGGGYILGGDSEGPSWGVIEDNYFIKGPSTGGTPAFVRGNANFQVCHKGNMLDYDTDGVLGGTLAGDDVYGPITLVPSYEKFTDSPQVHPTIATQTTATEAYEWIKNNVGATLPVRDEVDKYVINELTSLGEKGALINGEADLGLVNGVGLVFTAPQQLDSDHDGMPDVWEDANGLNKNDAADAILKGAGGYLNIETYIHSITAGQPFVKNATSLSVRALKTDFITLKWKNNADISTSVVLEQSTNGTDFTAIATLANTDMEYKVEGLTPSTTYYFRLITKNGEMISEPSAILKIATQGEATPPVACTEPMPETGSVIKDYTSINLTWENVTGTWAGKLSYNVFVGETADNLAQVATDLNVQTYTLSLQEGKKYFWRVDTKNVLGSKQGDIWSFTSGKKPQREKLGYWTFDEMEGTTAANDVIGYATAKDFVPIWVAGKIGNAISFPGTATSGFVQEHYDVISLGNESFSIELWFKSEGGIVDWYLIHKGSHSKNVAKPGTTGKWFGLQYNKTGKNDRLTWAIDDNDNKTDLDVKPGSTYFNNEWNHVVCIRDVENKKLQMYINGELKGEKVDGTGDIGGIENMAIGNCNTAYENAFKGLMDDVSIYNAALTAAEVKNKYEVGLATLIGNMETTKEINAFPLPFSFELKIVSVALTDGIANVQLYDVSGRLVFETQQLALDNQLLLSGLENLPRGLYTCIVQTDNHSFSMKVIK